MSKPGGAFKWMPPPGVSAGLLTLAAATLLFEIHLTRLFSVAQFYHFAFMIISLAMVGFGASGMLLALFPQWGARRPQAALALIALGYGVGSVAAYLLTNVLPFDSFSIAWDPRQVGILVLHSLVLALPFFCSGAAVGMLFVRWPEQTTTLYALNLAGSAAGCLLALLAPVWGGGEGVILLSGALGGVSALSFALAERGSARLRIAALAWLVGCGVVVGWSPDFFTLRLSPYKGLSYALQFPGARIASQRWNSFSRIDLVKSGGIRSLPGLSYRYLGPLPAQQGLFVDGDDLSPVLQLSPAILSQDAASSTLAFTAYLPTAAAYALRPEAEVLVLEPRGGLEVWTALAQGAAQVTAVEANPLIVEAAGEIYTALQVTPAIEEPRSFVRCTPARYDVVVLALTTPYHPIRSGAYSLAEDYRYTVEAFRDDLAVQKPGGLLVVTRWLQVPPSESLRAYALAVAAVEASGGDPARLTLLVKQGAFTGGELETLRSFAADRAFDLVALPGLRPEETNRYNVLEQSIYAETFADLLQAADREGWYAAYPFDVAPPTDDRPFFGHFFKSAQTGQVLAELGKSWQPFGGAGYFVLLAFLGLALALAAPIVLLPWAVGCARQRLRGARGTMARVGLYFALLGLGYLFIEIPLIQCFILFLGHPAYAMTAVLFSLLFFSGIGSLLSPRLPLRLALGLVAGLAVATRLLLPPLFAAALPLPFGARLCLAILTLSPLGMAMGMPFPLGLRWLDARAPQAVPWAWGVNGAASVVASVLAALLSLAAGFRWVLIVGALCYAGAWGVLSGRGGSFVSLDTLSCEGDEGDAT
ncbi:MAG: hypothetical protein RBT47_07420 [Anaerolineae bacterium]|jgi:hypothetical protein|nr:hypothetical protein [Anaerolineae bacterium]